MKSNLLLFLLLFVIVSSVCKAQNPTLWGMTYLGGANLNGTMFSYNIATGIETDVHNFGSDTDGQQPFRNSLILASNGLIYGMTSGGGNNHFSGGVIFSYNISDDSETVVHDFGHFNDGEFPFSSLIQTSNGLLYGVTYEGGTDSAGTIFSFNISSGAETDLHDFGTGTDGRSPIGALIQATNGLLYGMTTEGGADSAGTIFSFDISSGVETDLYDFGDSTDGRFPYASLIQASNGMLYGMTTEGGVDSLGIIFSFDISSAIETDLHDFGNLTDGAMPFSSLVQLGNGLLYGTTGGGGTNGFGTIFSYDIPKSNETDIYDFGSSDTDGKGPLCSLIQASNGLLYGTTLQGGLCGELDGYGTIFSFDILTGKETDLHNFGCGTDGYYPICNLIETDVPSVINQLPNNADNIHLYPNPSSDDIHLSLKLQQEQLVNVSLYNTLGQQVWGEDLGKAKEVATTIPLTNLANGVYMLKVNAGGSLQEKEVVVKR